VPNGPTRVQQPWTYGPSWFQVGLAQVTDSDFGTTQAQDRTEKKKTDWNFSLNYPASKSVRCMWNNFTYQPYLQNHGKIHFGSKDKGELYQTTLNLYLCTLVQMHVYQVIAYYIAIL